MELCTFPTMGDFCIFSSVPSPKMWCFHILIFNVLDDKHFIHSSLTALSWSELWWRHALVSGILGVRREYTLDAWIIGHHVHTLIFMPRSSIFWEVEENQEETHANIRETHGEILHRE